MLVRMKRVPLTSRCLLTSRGLSWQILVECMKIDRASVSVGCAHVFAYAVKIKLTSRYAFITPEGRVAGLSSLPMPVWQRLGDSQGEFA